MRVGHRIIDINSQSVVAVPHEKIVNLLATSVGEVSKTRVISITVLKVKVLDVCNKKRAIIISTLFNWLIIYYQFLHLQIRMKTMPTSIFRLLTGQETPQYI